MGGPFKQLLADMQLIKAEVFLGGRAPDTDPLSYAQNLDRHYSAVAALHPKLLDTYFLAESSLAWINPEYAERTNQILSSGFEPRADQWSIPFFAGFNAFRYLQDNAKAVHYLTIAKSRPASPEWINSLTRLLSMDGGDIVVGFLLLREMKHQSSDPLQRASLDRDMTEYQKALLVLRGLGSFKNSHGHLPNRLSELTPEFLPNLPRMENGYELEFVNQQLHLRKTAVR